MSRETELLDSTPEQQGFFSARRLKRIYSVLFLLAMIYALILFTRYWLVAQQFNNPLLPEYTINFIYGSDAFAGVLLMAGMIVSFITKSFHTKTGLIILLITFGLIPFSDAIYTLITQPDSF